MTDPNPKLDRLGQALDAFFAFRDGDGSQSEDQVLAENAEVRDLLEPLLRHRDDAGHDEPDDDDPMIGRILDDFRLVRQIGRGAMGVVYEGRQVSLDRTVAIKLLPPAAALQPARTARFKREATLVGRLNHEGITEVIAVGEHDGLHYYAMELVEGAPLNRVLRSFAPDVAQLEGSSVATAVRDLAVRARGFAQAEASASERTAWRHGYVEQMVALAAQIADALEYAHEHDVIHRDVKPSNILIRADGRAVLSDFGLAREEGLPSMTMTGDFAGTPYYVSPEQARARPGNIDRRTDVFSLGVTLYELVTLRRPFDGETSHDVLQAILHREPADPRKWTPSVPVDLSAIVLKALEKDVRRRYQRAADFAEDLRAFLEFRPVTARRASTVQRVARWIRREPLRATVAALLIAGTPIVAGLGGYVLAQQDVIETGEQELFDRRVARKLESAYLFNAKNELRKAVPLFDEILDLVPGHRLATIGRSFALVDGNDPSAALASLSPPRLHPSLVDDRAIDRARAAVLRRLDRTSEANAIEGQLGPPANAEEAFVVAEHTSVLWHDDPAATGPDALAESLQWFDWAILHGWEVPSVFHLQRAHVLSHLDEPELRRSAADFLEATWPDSAAAWFWASRLVEVQDPRRAIGMSERAVELEPDDLLFRHLHGQHLFHDGDYTAGLEQLRLLEQTEGRANPMLLYDIATCLANLGQLEESLPYFERSARLDPANPHNHSNWANALRRLGRLDEAKAAIDRSIALNPNVPSALNKLGVICAMRREYAAAEEAFDRLIALDPDYRSAWFNVAKLREIRGDVAGALEALEEGLARDPGRVQAWVGRGNHCVTLGRDPDAIAAYEQALELAPTRGDVMWGLARAYGRVEQAEDAIAMYRQARANGIDDTRCATEEASVLRRLERYDEATTLLGATLDADPESADAHAEHAHILIETGDAAKAAAAVSRALAIDASHELALTLKEKLDGSRR